MDAAQKDPSRSITSCRQFRDGLQIALLAARPLRKKNFSALSIGAHIRVVQGEWRIMIPGEETKEGPPIDVPFPPMLAEHLVLYLEEFRPRLLKSSTDALWISQYGGRQSPDSISHNIGRLTAMEFGEPINLHLFRDCAATSIAVEAPENINIVASVLGHASLAASQEHYNQARSIDASRRFLSTLAALRAGTRPKAKMNAERVSPLERGGHVECARGRGANALPIGLAFPGFHSQRSTRPKQRRRNG